eukprot:354861-Chlamydomonas_euryale.AAC.16
MFLLFKLHNNLCTCVTRVTGLQIYQPAPYEHALQSLSHSLTNSGDHVSKALHAYRAAHEGVTKVTTRTPFFTWLWLHGPSLPASKLERPHRSLALHLLELFNQLLLLASEALGDLDPYVDLVVAALRYVAEAGYATLGHEQRRARLCARRDLQLDRPVDCRDLDLRAQDCVDVRNLHVRVDGRAVTAQLWMRLDRDEHVQVARLAAAAS